MIKKLICIIWGHNYKPMEAKGMAAIITGNVEHRCTRCYRLYIKPKRENAEGLLKGFKRVDME